MPPADELFAIIERHGVIGPPGLLKLSNLPAKQLDKLYHETFHAIYDAQLEMVWIPIHPVHPTPFPSTQARPLEATPGAALLIVGETRLAF